MGCWSKTCGISNLPINSGEEVYVFILEKNKYDDDRCYTTSFFKPLLLPFKSIYNDYGGGENSNGVAFHFIMDAIREKLIEVDIGENECHDIAVTKDTWSEELLFESMQEHRLRILQSGEETQLDFVMFREDIVDNILKTHKILEYVGHNKGDCGHDNSYISYGINEIINDLSEIFDIFDSLTDAQKKLLPFSKNTILRKANNKASKFISTDMLYRYSKIIDVFDMAAELYYAEQKILAEALLVEHIKAKILDEFMYLIRKVWIPGTHEGSQNNDLEPYLTLMKCIHQVIEIEST